MKFIGGKVRALSLFLVVLVVAIFSLTSLTPVQADGTVASCNEAGLRAALNAGGNITFTCSGTITLASTITISKPATLDASGRSVVISGGNAVQIFFVNTGVNFTLKNLTLANGRVQGEGGAIYNNSGTLTVINCTFNSNNAVGTGQDFTYGGAITNYGTLNVSGSVFSGNRVISDSSNPTAGGAISNFKTLSIGDSIFSGNQASGGTFAPGQGGAVFNQDALTINNTNFSSNSTNGPGGAILHNPFIGRGSLNINTSAFSGNQANSSDGGALYITASDFTITSSLFASNAIGGNDNRGGAIYANTNDSKGLIANSTFYGNSVGGNGYAQGGAIYLSTSSGSNTILNSTFASNTAKEGSAIYGDSHTIIKNTLISGGSGVANCSSGLTDGGNNLQWPDNSCSNSGTVANPKLGGLQNNGGPTQTVALLPGSPAINAGNNSVCAAPPINNKDQRGFNRTFGSSCDIGAYELASSGPNVSLKFSPTVIGTGGSSVLEIGLINSGQAVLTNVSVSDNLPAQIQIAGTPGISSNCGSSSVNASAGGNSISISGVTLNSGIACIIKVNVTSSSVGSWLHNTGTISAAETGTGAVSNPATLKVAATTILVTNNADSGAGSLRAALSSATNGTVINISLNPSQNQITLLSALPEVPPGVSLNATCTNGKPDVIISGAGLNANGLTLKGGSSLYGLQVKGFGKKQIQLSGSGNLLECVIGSK